MMPMTRLQRPLRLCAGLLAAAVLAACSSSPKAPEPAPLAPVAALMSTRLAWNVQVGQGSETLQTVLWQIRGPRVLAAVAVGAALALAGAAFQGLFRNPLVSPDILGASAGSALGAVLGIYASVGLLAIQASAFAGGLLAVAGNNFLWNLKLN